MINYKIDIMQVGVSIRVQLLRGCEQGFVKASELIITAVGKNRSQLLNEISTNVDCLKNVAISTRRIEGASNAIPDIIHEYKKAHWDGKDSLEI